MTKEELTGRLNGREYLEEITKEEEAQAKAAGLVVLFGASDDLAEYRGAIHDEDYPGRAGDLLLTRGGPLERHGDCDCKYCGFSERRASAAEITAIWSEGDYSWQYKTTIPHATFEIVEGSEKYCRGIVFNLSDLPA